MSDSFPELIVSGSAFERGVQHGTAFKNKIASTIDFYAAIFKLPVAEIFDRARHFQRLIADYRSDFIEEMDGIAKGADVNPFWIVALNSRSEILSFDASCDANECTALYFRKTAVLGQNWDWEMAMESNTVLMRVDLSNGTQIQMLTEPGIIGKIGLNSHGLGVCLNILRIDKPLDGIPIHIVLRSILESPTIDSALDEVRSCGVGKASNALIGDASGNCVNVEFAGNERFEIRSFGDFMIHTNHVLSRHINPNDETFHCSYSRLHAAEKRASSLVDFSIDEMKDILVDGTGEYPICRPYKKHKDVQKMGTIASIVMDLKQRRFHIRRGPGSGQNYETPQKTAIGAS